MARFTFSEFERNLEGLTDEEARVRLTKADGSLMNGISWIVGHVAQQRAKSAPRAFLNRAQDGPEATGLLHLRERLRPYATGVSEATPPPLAEALDLLTEAKSLSRWIDQSDDEFLCRPLPDLPPARSPAYQEADAWIRSTRHSGSQHLGTLLVLDVLHTWIHLGEINLIRQLLGHAPTNFAGPLIGNLEWRPVGYANLAAGPPARLLPYELAASALGYLDECLENVSDSEGNKRLRKADESATSAISWIVAHVGRHWLAARAAAIGDAMSSELQRFASGSTDPTPPPLSEAVRVLEAAKRSIDWIASAGEELLLNGPPSPRSGERPGTRVLSAVLHTLFHAGEIDGIRQMLGHVFASGRNAFAEPWVGKPPWRAQS